METEREPGAPEVEPIAYLLKRYPRLSETFILHEMLALEARGVPLRVFSIHDPAEALTHPDVQRLRATVTYVPAVAPRALLRMARAHAARFLRGPRSYVRVLRQAVFRADPLANLRHFLRAGWLGHELQRAGIRQLHAHFAHGPAATAHFTHLLYGIPYSFTAHAKDIYTTPPRHLAERIRAARFVVTCTEHNAAYLAALVDRETARRITRVYHGVDLRRFFPQEAVGGESVAPPLILAVGRLVEKKGLNYLIEACALLRERGVAFRCELIGGGPLREALRARIQALGLADAVVLRGACTQDEVARRYPQAAVVALPCVVLENGDRDGIPNVLVEAMSMRVPVVATTVSGIPELVRHEHNGLLVPPRDVEALATALATLLGDSALRHRLGLEAERTVRARFDLARNAELLHALFADATESQSTRWAAQQRVATQARLLV